MNNDYQIQVNGEGREEFNQEQFSKDLTQLFQRYHISSLTAPTGITSQEGNLHMKASINLGR